ncbi:GNAT family N-acetyltransferase [Aquihabitans sp. G128]|uniref:GNAT family N-acetyltransferase n=1 Tax=Aquihabitans sp. G128 TaxID=2849779 RepID=UPI001C22CE65|nr:GNAT family N-acetyltransferase [Aquihabitans sp. G128]QXC61962.1 GNAT family N-acetyltransferase [Aquihabitans sp. G128]
MEGARAASAADAVVVAALARQGIAELSPNRGGSLWSRREAHAEPLDGAIAAAVSGADPDVRAVVGTVDDTIVGYGIMHVEQLHDGRPLAVVTDLYVDPGARAIGIGEAMMDLLIADARAVGAVGIDAIALPGDRHTKNFFETFGLTARAILVHRSLEEPAAAVPDPDRVVAEAALAQAAVPGADPGGEVG